MISCGVFFFRLRSSTATFPLKIKTQGSPDHSFRKLKAELYFEVHGSDIDPRAVPPSDPPLLLS